MHPMGCNHDRQVSENADPSQLAKVTVGRLSARPRRPAANCLDPADFLREDTGTSRPQSLAKTV